MRIGFYHPDLGIGGAERLVIDAALGLQDLGHDVTVYTSHCDSNHAFEEARNGKLKVCVYGDFLPTSIGGRCKILCAIARQAYLILRTSLHAYDAYFVDQLSAGILLLQFRPGRILFYLHFPDMLMSRDEVGWLAKVKTPYRLPFDLLERWSTRMADCVVVNSHFTAGKCKEIFSIDAPVVYPCVEMAPREEVEVDLGKLVHTPYLLSINRFERKKNIELAIRAVAETKLRLVVAGGYDPLNQENLDYHISLIALCTSLGLSCATLYLRQPFDDDSQVLFLPSVSSQTKTSLIHHALILLYTPPNEHFGIVPLEAMAKGKAVLAMNSGGPRETVEHDVSGWLYDSLEEWVRVIKQAAAMPPSDLASMGACGQARVTKDFSRATMAWKLQKLLHIPVHSLWPPWIVLSGFLLVISIILSYFTL